MEKNVKPGRPAVRPLPAVLRTLRIIEYLVDADAGLSVTEISRLLQVNKSISFRILATLCDAGYVYRSEPGQNYRATCKVSNLGLRQLATSRLIDQSGPILRQLAEDTGELVRLAVIEENKPIWVHAASGLQRRLMIDPVYGHEIISHMHAAGKAWLMTLPEDAVSRIIGKREATKQAPYRMPSLSQLLADLRKSRKRGFALNYEQTDVGVGAIAAPILVGKDQTCVGAISVAAPTSRMGRDALIAVGPAVIKAATKLADVWPLERNLLTSSPSPRKSP